MPLASGSSLGPYEILMPIRAGGMGEVYRARDSRLGRDGRVKILDFGLAGVKHLYQKCLAVRIGEERKKRQGGGEEGRVGWGLGWGWRRGCSEVGGGERKTWGRIAGKNRGEEEGGEKEHKGRGRKGRGRGKGGGEGKKRRGGGGEGGVGGGEEREGGWGGGREGEGEEGGEKIGEAEGEVAGGG